MQLVQHQHAMLQLHLSDQQFNCLHVHLVQLILQTWWYIYIYIYIYIITDGAHVSLNFCYLMVHTHHLLICKIFLLQYSDVTLKK